MFRMSLLGLRDVVNIDASFRLSPMSPNLHFIALEQMRDHGREAMSLLAGKSRRDLETDRVLSLAVVRLLEILGEAARRRARARDG
jgi:hypothetical protein